MDSAFSREQSNASASGYGSKWAVLTALRAKAICLREKTHPRNLGKTSEDSNSALAHVADDGSPETGTVPAYGLGDAGNGELSFDVGYDEWLNWETLAQNFQHDGPAVPAALWQ